MAYYNKLWDYLEKHHLSQNDLMHLSSISQTTITNMRNNKSVSVHTLHSIAIALNCDFKDIVSAYPPENKGIDALVRERGVDFVNLRNALSHYMNNNNLKISEIAHDTTLSVNTVKSFLRGNDISDKSVKKLLTLKGFPIIDEFLL